MSEHIVAVYENNAAADAAAIDLQEAGIPSSAIRRYRPGAGAGVTREVATGETSSGGFWSWLLGEDTDSAETYYPRDRDQYEHGAQAGNAVLSVDVHDDSRISRVISILEAHDPISMDEDSDEYDVAEVAAPMRTDVGSEARRAGEEVIPLAEEQLEIGKRTVDRGTTRVRRYVVERPVEKDVTLRGQRVTIERRRPVTSTGVAGQAFEERVVEVHETEEVPVVAKTARVVEEVAIRKEETERTETVRDTVRREEVEVSDERGRQPKV